MFINIQNYTSGLSYSAEMSRFKSLNPQFSFISQLRFIKHCPIFRASVLSFIILVNVEHLLYFGSGYCLWVLKLIEIVSQAVCSGCLKEFTC